jgi:V/A-type H+-transporting ATPase subunit B
MTIGPIIYTKLDRIEGPLMTLISSLSDVGFGESVHLIDRQGRKRHGRVVLLDGDKVTVEIFEGTAGLSNYGCKMSFTGKPITLNVDENIIGRKLDGLGRPIDGGPPLTGEPRLVQGHSINPVGREYPQDFIQTGISGIDVMNSLVRGQKLPIFSSSGLPHDQLAIQIAQQAEIRPDLSGRSGQEEELIVVFAAIGVKHDVALRFSEEISGRMVAFLNLADDPPMERLLTPRMALSAAEYFAFEKGQHVLVILTDMTVYCEALREIATASGDVPSRKGYPGYLYSDLASIFERAGRIKGKSGSITQLPILTMPDDDITHPIPDLTGYITEGQIVLSRDLSRQGLYPPINLLPSLSRLMGDGVGQGLTRKDHLPLMGQLYAAYSRVQEVRMMSRIIGEADLPDVDKCYLDFGKRFERIFVCQGPDENRSIEDSLDLGWQCLGCLPQQELTRLTEADIKEYKALLKKGAGAS